MGVDTRAVGAALLQNTHGMQSRKEHELATQRATEERQLASAVLSKYSEEQRERGELADLHAKHDVLRECAPLPARRPFGYLRGWALPSRVW